MHCIGDLTSVKNRLLIKSKLALINLKTSLLTQDVVLTSIQRRFNVMDVRQTLKQRCVLTGIDYHVTKNTDKCFANQKSDKSQFD